MNRIVCLLGVLALGAGAALGAPGELCLDQVAVGVEDGLVRVTHTGALYNCCPDDAVFSVQAEGGVLRIIEAVPVTDPCRCGCCTDLSVDIGGLAGGTYELHYLWQDNDSPSPFWQEHVEQVVVPGVGIGMPFVAASAHACGTTAAAGPRTWGAIKGVFR